MRRQSFKMRAAALGAVAAVLATAIALGTAFADAAVHHQHRRARATVATMMSESAIQSAALAGAAANGDPSPSLIEHAEGPFSQAVATASGSEGASGNAPTLVVVEKGKFVDSSASVPYIPGGPQVPQPAGTVLTLVIDEASGQQTGIGISNSAPDLADLGAVTTDSSSATDSEHLRTQLRRGIAARAKR